ncbi:MAG: hypothetical protein Ta2B_12000 [Termitinemataceae bacterium]|nr:MAG: hypothetical protein Ta2B_12000 [Termitinemataceae bacterium]
MAIYGYSERGVVNAMAYYLNANSKYLHGFIEILGFSLEKKDYGEDYEILVDQSFSDFGVSDLIIILDNKSDKKIVVFIECKIKTSQGTYNINNEFNKIDKAIKESDKITGISSNLFVQLYYKHLLIVTDGGKCKEPNVNEIFKKSKGNPRIIGGNDIVKGAFNKIKNASDYYYVAIVPTAPNEMNSEEFKKKIDELGTMGMSMPSENAYLCYWGNIEKYFSDPASEVSVAFKYNDGQIY